MTTFIAPANTAKNLEVRKFMDEVRGWFGNIDVKLTVAHQESAKIFFEAVVEFTPKKTGYASYNWRVANSGGNKTLNNSLEPRIDKKDHYSGRTVDPPDFTGIRWNSNSTVYNFVPYIEIINQQSSSPHFFEHAEALAENTMRGHL